MKHLIWAFSLAITIACWSCIDDSTGNSIDIRDRDEQIIKDYLADNNITDYSRTEFGVYYHTITEGTGQSIPSDSILLIGYQGRLPYGNVFDDSFARKDTFELLKRSGAIVSSYDTINCVPTDIGVNTVLCDSCPNFSGGVISGWVDAIQLLNVGDRKRFYIPSTLGYGSSGSGSAIPPNAVLIFDIEAYGYKGYSADCF